MIFLEITFFGHLWTFRRRWSFFKHNVCDLSAPKYGIIHEIKKLNKFKLFFGFYADLVKNKNLWRPLLIDKTIKIWLIDNFSTKRIKITIFWNNNYNKIVDNDFNCARQILQWIAGYAAYQKPLCHIKEKIIKGQIRRLKF